MALTPEQRRIRSSIAGYARSSKYDGREMTATARARFLARFLDEVDPDRQLPEPERIRRAEAALRAHMKRLALRSARARGRRAANR
jgi:hypothetical protein